MDISDAVVTRFLDAFGRVRQDVFFVQVGSNDGEHNDPLRPFILGRKWRGIMIEPVPYVFKRLERNYGCRADLTLVNAAMTNYDGFAEFYCLSESSDSLPEWYDQLGSFTLEPMLDGWIQEVIPDIRERVTTITVPCVTFESLCRRHHVERVDLLHIDAEGHDFEIIKTIDFVRRRPTVILYEHKHLSPSYRLSCRRLLARADFLSLELAYDTLCVDRAVAAAEPGLGQAWRDAIAAMAVEDPTA